MKKLADISAFEALASHAVPASPVSNAVSTENGRLSNYLGHKVVDKYIFGPTKTIPRDSVRYKNAKVVVDRGKGAVKWLRENMDKINDRCESGAHYTDRDIQALTNGFCGFALLCANLDFDVSDIVKDLGIVFHTKPIRAYSSVEDLGMGFGPGRLSAADVAHELTHLLFRYPQVRQGLKEKINLPWRMGEREDLENHEKFPQDKLRAWIAGDDYAGKEYHYEMDDNAGDDYDFNSEYLPMLFYAHQMNKLPLMYALDVKRLLKKINKLANKGSEESKESKEELEKPAELEVAYA